MTAFRVKTVLSVLLAALLASPAYAQTPAAETTTVAPAADAAPVQGDGREASFMPPPGAPQPLVSSPDAAATPAAATTTAAASTATNSFPFPLVPITQPDDAAAPAKAPVATPATVPVATPVIPSYSPLATTASSSPAPSPAPASAIIGSPVESSTLKNIDAGTVGLLSAEGGGLGASMWKGTPRELIDHLMPALALPSTSPALNSLAQRLFLTTANPPEGDAGKTDLLSLRVKGLIALGDAADAWNLTLVAKPGQIDDATLRQTVEAALVSSAAKDVCTKLPDIIHSHSGPEWQELLVTCQLSNNDTEAAQLGLEVLHAQNAPDDTFLQLAEHDIVEGGKSLPRQLTPLKPLPLVLLRILDKPLPTEVYAHPDAAVIPELLKAKARSEDVRLALAERAAGRGILTAAQLADTYRNIGFAGTALTDALHSTEKDARLRALLYQAAVAEKTPRAKLDDAIRFYDTLDATGQNGATAQLLAQLIADVPASNDFVGHAPSAARIFIMAGKPKEALAWLIVARTGSTPEIAAQLQSMWPLIALSGTENVEDFAPHFAKWLDGMLKDADHAPREQLGGILLLLDAAGYGVPEAAWSRVIAVPEPGKKALPPPVLLIERMRLASEANRRGETLLLALASFGASGSDFPLLAAVETIRALRFVGLKSDALTLARETTSHILMPLEPTPGRP